MALTKEDLHAIAKLTRSIVKEELEPIKEDIDEIKKVAAKVDHDVVPKISALHDGYQLHNDKLDNVQASIDEMAPTVTALDVLHQMQKKVNS